MAHYDYLIVGAGFAGAVTAERLASQRGRRCLVIDRRGHVAGNAHDYHDAAGVLVHAHGPHYFRTNEAPVVEYLSQFTDWIDARYTVRSHVDGTLYNFPINLNTFEQIIGRPSTTEEMQATLAQWREPIDDPANSEEAVVAQVGRRLYRMFFQGYTRKQWDRDPRELDASVCRRIPIRTNRDDRYLREKFQKMPRDGYTAMFHRMLDHPGIELSLGVDLAELGSDVTWDHMIYTGPIDAYFDHRFGRLPYRSLRFEHTTYPVPYYQPVVQINFPGDEPWTRCVEAKHVTGQQLPVTTVVREYPQTFGPGREPYYPMPTTEAKSLYARYAELADAERGVTFLGRLAEYRYYNMDQVVARALAVFEELEGTERLEIRRSAA